MPVFIELVQWLDDLTVERVLNLLGGRVVIETAADELKVSTTLHGRVRDAANHFVELPRDVRVLKNMSSETYEATLLFVTQKLLFAACAIANATPPVLKPVFPGKGQSLKMPSILARQQSTAPL
jgi:hypothetical protein